MPKGTDQIGVGRWQIRLFSDDPSPGAVRYVEEMYEPTMRPVLARLRTLLGRTSHNVNGQNRTVKFILARWNWRREEWQEVNRGESKLKEGMMPQ